MNYRFSQSGRTERNRQNHLYIEGRFPFANVMTHDPITQQFDSRYRSCERTNTCPLGMEIYSANEYWVKSASLLHTTPDGTRDLPDSRYTRNYFMSSMRHGTAATPGGIPGTPPNRGLCQQSDNPLNSAPVQRALFIALDEWATEGRDPPRSRVPKLRDGTLVPPLPQSEMGFPDIPSPFADTPGPLVTYTGLKTTRYHFDYGLNFYETGIATINPPVFPFMATSYQDDPRNGPIYPSFIPKTDSDGNDIAGVRLPDVTVPVATYTGWALRRGVQANDGCEAAGQFIPFARTEAEARRRSAPVGRGAVQNLRGLPPQGGACDHRLVRPPDAVRRRRDRGGAADAGRQDAGRTTARRGVAGSAAAARLRAGRAGTAPRRDRD